MRTILRVSIAACAILAACCACSADNSSNESGFWAPGVDSEWAIRRNLWPDGLGLGLRKGAQTAGFGFGTGSGMKIFGGTETHDLVLGRLCYGRVLTDVVGGQCWPRGNFEWRLELMGAGQYRPKDAYLIGLTPLLRYDFATGSRWMPFVDIGAGLSVTDIGRPDLSTGFEFNIQAGGGLNYFVRPNTALTLQYRYLHVSNARIAYPDHGVNIGVASTGMTWYF